MSMDARHILVVDDDENIGIALVRGLEHHGYRATWAVDGQKAVEIHRRDPAALVISDILMPEMDGLELIRQLRKVDAQLPVIAISGGGQHMGPDELLKVANQMGADHILEKPFSLDDLMPLLAARFSDG